MIAEPIGTRVMLSTPSCDHQVLHAGHDGLCGKMQRLLGGAH